MGDSPSAARGSASRCTSATASIPTTSSCPRHAPRARPDQHRHLPARQPRPGRLGHQEHRDRPVRRRRRRRLPQDRPGQVFTTERAAIAAIKARREIQAGDVLVLICRGPMGAGMEEIVPDHLRPQAPAVRQARRGDHRRPLLRRLAPARASATSAPRPWPAGRSARCATATVIRIVIDRNKLDGSIDLVGDGGTRARRRSGARGRLAARRRAGPRARPALPADTRLWAALQDASGGTWGGCVYDVDAVVELLRRR